jgi:hypothetical protein
MAFHGHPCTECGSPDCDGCPEADDPIDSETISLMETPEGMDLAPIEKTGDQRDMTRPPPAVLSPHSVLRNRNRARKFLATGEFSWPRDTV